MDELARAVSQFGLNALLDHIHALVLLVESDGKLTAWNAAFNPIRAAFPNANKLEEFITAEEAEEFRRRLQNACESNSPSQWTVNILIDKPALQRSFNGLLLPLPQGRVLFIAEQMAVNPAVAETIERMNRQVRLFRIESEHAKKLALNKQSEVEAVIAQAQEVSNIDELTFLPNHRQIIRELQSEVIRAERYNSLLSISLLDIDHFKQVNDTYGRAVGDQVLRAIAVMLQDDVRQPDIVSRYGGEEFLILLPSSEQDAAVEQAARLCKKVREAVIPVEEHVIHVTISIGVAQFQNGIDDWNALLSRADSALDEAKKAGGDQWMVSKG